MEGVEKDRFLVKGSVKNTKPEDGEENIVEEHKEDVNGEQNELVEDEDAIKGDNCYFRTYIL